jgi:hypothetical protein
MSKKRSRKRYEASFKTRVALAAVRGDKTLSELAESIAMLNNQEIDGQLTALRTQTDISRQRLFWEATVLVPLVLLAVVAFTLGLGRPLRQIDRAITELGSGHFANEGRAHLRVGHPGEATGSVFLSATELDRNRVADACEMPVIVKENLEDLGAVAVVPVGCALKYDIQIMIGINIHASDIAGRIQIAGEKDMALFVADDVRLVRLIVQDVEHFSE